jgi:hypothetical protein
VEVDVELDALKSALNALDLAYEVGVSSLKFQPLSRSVVSFITIQQQVASDYLDVYRSVSPLQFTTWRRSEA